MAQPKQDVPIVEEERPFIVDSWQAYATGTFCAFTMIDYFLLLVAGSGKTIIWYAVFHVPVTSNSYCHKLCYRRGHQEVTTCQVGLGRVLLF